MNDEFGKTSQDLKIDKMVEDINQLFLGVNELSRTSVTKDIFNTERDKLRNDVGQEIRLVGDIQVEIKEIMEFLKIANRDIQYLLREDRKNRR